jgi:PIN domain nuclease of toxin-antitoxin system
MMRLLLDTHIFLWLADDSPQLDAKARRLLVSASAIYVSSASIWEVAIKSRLGKIRTDPEELLQEIEKCGFHELPVLGRHAVAVAQLPLYHADPFDRLLVAQALTEPMRLVTKDAQLRQYSDLIITV